MRTLSTITRRAAVSMLIALGVFAGSATAVAAADAPNTCAAATTASPINKWIRGEITSGTDIDWYRFNKPSTNFSLLTLGALPKDYRLDLYNSSCVRLTGSNRPGFEFEEIYRSMPVGTYFVRVATTSASQYSTRQYALRLRTLPTGVFIVSSAPAYVDSINYLHIPGEVLNNTGGHRQFVEIVATYYNSANAVIATDFTYTTLMDLRSRGRSPFEMSTPAPAGYHHHKLSVSSSPQPTAPVSNLVLSAGIPYTDSISYRHYPGEVRNANSFAVTFVQVAMTLYNGWGYVIGTDFTFTDPYDLAAGQTAPYEVVTNHWAGTNRAAFVVEASR